MADESVAHLGAATDADVDHLHDCCEVDDDTCDTTTYHIGGCPDNQVDWLDD